MAKKMTFFTLYTRDADIIDCLDDDAAGRLLKGLYHHAIGDDVMLCGDEMMAFKFITKAMDEHSAKYEQVCEKRRAAAEARWNGTLPQPEQMDANACTSMQMHTDALKENVKEKEKEKVKEQ